MLCSSSLFYLQQLCLSLLSGLLHIPNIPDNTIPFFPACPSYTNYTLSANIEALQFIPLSLCDAD